MRSMKQRICAALRTRAGDPLGVPFCCKAATGTNAPSTRVHSAKFNRLRAVNSMLRATLKTGFKRRAFADS